MQIVILAGGIGTRLRPLTYSVSKPMVKVCGKPFLEYQLELVKSFGFTNVLILAGYLGNQIEEYFGDGSILEMNIKYSYEETPMGTGGALKNAEKMLSKTFILLNGDTLLTINYNKLAEQFKKNDKMGLIVAWNNPDNIIPHNLQIADDNTILAYNKDVSDGMTHLDAGVIALKKEVLKLIPPQRVCLLEKEVYPQLINSDELAAFETEQRFYDMGSVEGLKNLEKALG